VKKENRLFVTAGELSTFGKEVFDRLKNKHTRSVPLDERYFERQGKVLSSKELREAKGRLQPSSFLAYSKPKFIDRNENYLITGFEVNFKDPKFLAELKESYRYIDRHIITRKDKEQLDKFRACQGFQYVLLLSDDFYRIENDAEALIRNRFNWYVDQDKPFVLDVSERAKKSLQSFANRWNVYHEKLCEVYTEDLTEGIIEIKLGVSDSKPPIDVDECVEFGESLIKFLKAPYDYQPENFYSILTIASRYRRGDQPEFPSLEEVYEELQKPPFNRLKVIQGLQDQGKLKSVVNNLRYFGTISD
jgi:hypothetical protein